MIEWSSYSSSLKGATDGCLWRSVVTGHSKQIKEADMKKMDDGKVVNGIVFVHLIRCNEEMEW